MPGKVNAREFLDTNIIVYAFTADPRAQTALDLLGRGCVTSVQAPTKDAIITAADAIPARPGQTAPGRHRPSSTDAAAPAANRVTAAAWWAYPVGVCTVGAPGG